MMFDDLGLPKEFGASDLQDSARLAGIVTVFDFAKVDLRNYVIYVAGRPKYCRHPSEIKYDFSRDQAICLMAGLGVQRLYGLVDQDLVDGKDIFSPAHKGHIARCKGEKASWFQDAWLWIDVTYSAFVKPLEEPNQLLCMLMLAPEKFLKFWLKHNKKWEQAIKDYWCEGPGAWRGEENLAQHMITVLKSKA